MRAHVLEVPAGHDVLLCIAEFALHGQCGALALLGLCVTGHIMLHELARWCRAAGSCEELVEQTANDEAALACVWRTRLVLLK
jgi:hypothetical protein